MTTLRAGADYPIDMTNIGLSDLEDGAVTKKEGHQVRISFSKYQYIDFFGSFSYDKDGDPSGGNITKIKSTYYGDTPLVIDHFSVRALKFLGWVQSGDEDSAVNYLAKHDDKITGSHKADFLIGMKGDDHLYGKAGNDALGGGAGSDVLSGGTGHDIFFFDKASHSPANGNRDLITDFSHADRINLDYVNPNLDFIGTDSFTGGGYGEVRYGSSSGKTIVYVDSNGDGTANMEIALKGSITLHASDFGL